MGRLLEFRKPRTGEVLSFNTRQYYISEDGMVYDGIRKRYVAQYENSKGYMAVSLRDDNGKRHTGIGVHRLLASCFLRLLENGEEVHHRNHDRRDNRLENLEIIDGSEHQRQHTIEKWAEGCFDAGRQKLKNVGSDYRPAKQVAQIDMNGHLVRVWPSTAEADRNGYNHRHVSECCNGKNKTHKKYRWMWLEDFEAQKEERQELETLASE